MSVTFRFMTLQGLLRQYGVTSIKQLCGDLKISRQYGWNLWHAEQGIGPVMMEKLHVAYRIPLEDLLHLEPVGDQKPRGRPRKRKKDGDGE